MEKEVKSFLREMGIEAEKTNVPLKGLEIDLYDPRRKIGVEIDGEYWHSSIFKKKNYHISKVLLGRKAGVHLVHIYEYEWNTKRRQQKTQGFLKRLFGISTFPLEEFKVQEISFQEGKKFVEENRISLKAPLPSTLYIGGYYKENLVCVGAFYKDMSKERWIMRGIYYSPEEYSFQEEDKILDFFEKKYFDLPTLVAFPSTDKEPEEFLERAGFERTGMTPIGCFYAKSTIAFDGEEIPDGVEIENYFKIYDCGSSVWIKEHR